MGNVQKLLSHNFTIRMFDNHIFLFSSFLADTYTGTNLSNNKNLHINPLPGKIKV